MVTHNQKLQLIRTTNVIRVLYSTSTEMRSIDAKTGLKGSIMGHKVLSNND